MEKKIRVVSLFSGIGGFEEGLKKSKLKHTVVFSSEIDKNAKISYKANFPTDNLFDDITKINELEIPDHDLLCAGFPCQAFSIAGQQLGFKDSRGNLFFDIVRILRVKTPKYILLENVKNLVSHDSGRTIFTILKMLEDIGYTVDFTVINSSESGVPQNRDRTYIIGVFNHSTEKFITDYRSVKIDKLKNDLNKTNYNSFNFFKNLTFSEKNKKIKDVLIDKPTGNYFLNSEKIQMFIESLEYKEEKTQKRKIIKLFDLPKEVHNDLERQRRVYSINGISPTILARSDSPKILVEYEGNLKIRKITPEENFYIQGFDKKFVENIKKTGMSNTQMYKQSGNAVSPPVITGIMNQLNEMIFKNKEHEKTFKFIDLFSGMGGFRIALEKYGGECVFSSDIDENARETYYQNFNEYPFGDITQIKEEDIPNHDILCAGFPCQPFSLAGKRLGFEDTRGTLFFDVLRILKEKKPKAFILENVAGLVSHDEGKTLSVIKNSLKEIGYTISYDTINSKDVGYPQNRNRWYCVGFLKSHIKMDDGDFNFPEKCNLKFQIADLLEEKVSKKYSITEIAKINIEYHLENFQKNSRYNEKQILIANEIRKSKCNFRCDGISPCLTAKMGTGGNNIPVLVSQNRKLTERECLRIMGYPETYKIKEHSYHSYKQIGNSVVVPVISKIAKEVLRILLEESK